jgi:hypothetical protein
VTAQRHKSVSLKRPRFDESKGFDEAVNKRFCLMLDLKFDISYGFAILERLGQCHWDVSVIAFGNAQQIVDFIIAEWTDELTAQRPAAAVDCANVNDPRQNGVRFLLTRPGHFDCQGCASFVAATQRQPHSPLANIVNDRRPPRFLTAVRRWRRTSAG